MTVNISKPAVNVREKLAELDKPTGIAGEAMLRAETPQEQFNLIGAGRRNILINGDFQVSQRGDYSSATSVSGGNYHLDRWYSVVSTINPTITHTDVQLPNGQYVKSMKIAATAGTGAGTGYCQMRQKVEKYYHLRGQYVTLSCWFKTTKGDNSGVNLAIYDNGSSVGWLKGEDLPNDGNWHFVSFTTKISDTISAYPEITIQHNNTWQSGEYYEVALMQLELGKVATPFEHRSYGEELALCQRYYQYFDGSDVDTFVTNIANWNGTSGYGGYIYMNTMRASPTVAISSASHFKYYQGGNLRVPDSLTLQNGTPQGVEINVDWTTKGSLTTAQAGWLRSENAACKMTFDAEL